MTDTGIELLAEILANPADDNVRLVYADWLQEHGDEDRAEFIRVQVTIAQIDQMRAARKRVPGGAAKKRSALDARSRELLPSCPPWFSLPGLRYVRVVFPTPPAGGVVSYWGEVTAPQFGRFEMFGWSLGEGEAYIWGESHRGFVSEVTCTAEDWIRHGGAIRAAHPVTAVALSTRPRCDVRGDGVTTLTYTVAGLAGEFDLHDLRRALGMTDTPRALRTNEVVLGAFAIRWPGVAFTLPTEPSTHTVPVTTFASDSETLPPPPESDADEVRRLQRAERRLRRLARIYGTG